MRIFDRKGDNSKNRATGERFEESSGEWTNQKIEPREDGGRTIQIVKRREDD